MKVIMLDDIRNVFVTSFGTNDGTRINCILEQGGGQIINLMLNIKHLQCRLSIK